MIFNRPLISAEWLAEQTMDPRLVLLDASLPPPGQPKPNLAQQRLPGAQPFDIDALFPSDSGLPHTMPDSARFSQVAQDCGVNADSRIVVYDHVGLFSAARVWWMFRVMGHQHVAVLDGGLPAWQQAGQPVGTGMQGKPAKGNWQGQLDPQQVKTSQQVLSALQQGTATVVDARSAGRFNGHEPEPRQGLRSGHMPGAVNLPFTSLLTNGRLRPVPQLREFFRSLTEDDKPMIFSCGSGVTACVLYLAAELCGYPNLAIYDGSWTEWGGRPELPVVTA